MGPIKKILHPQRKPVVTDQTIASVLDQARAVTESVRSRGIEALKALDAIPEDNRLRRASPIPDDDSPAIYLETGMVTQIKCSQCKAIVEEWDAYANHIKEKHPTGDDIRLKWAENVLEDYQRARQQAAQAVLAKANALEKAQRDAQIAIARRRAAEIVNARRRQIFKDICKCCLMSWAWKPGEPKPVVVPTPPVAAIPTPREVVAVQAKQPDPVVVPIAPKAEEQAAPPAPVAEPVQKSATPRKTRRKRTQRTRPTEAEMASRPFHCGKPMGKRGTRPSGATQWVCRVCEASDHALHATVPADDHPQPQPKAVDVDANAPLCCEGKAMVKVKVAYDKGRAPQQIFRCTVCDRRTVKEITPAH